MELLRKDEQLTLFTPKGMAVFDGAKELIIKYDLGLGCLIMEREKDGIREQVSGYPFTISRKSSKLEPTSKIVVPSKK